MFLTRQSIKYQFPCIFIGLARHSCLLHCFSLYSIRGLLFRCRNCRICGNASLPSRNAYVILRITWHFKGGYGKAVEYIELPKLNTNKSLWGCQRVTVNIIECDIPNVKAVASVGKMCVHNIYIRKNMSFKDMRMTKAWTAAYH